MFAISLEVIHVVFIVCALVSGLITIARIISDRPFGKWSLIFLQASLAASAVGILLSFFRPDNTRWIAVAGIYISGLAVLAWRRFHVRNAWADVFVLSTVAVLCLDIVMLAGHVFQLISRFVPTLSVPSLGVDVVVALAILLFAGLGRRALRNAHSGPNHRLVHRPGR